MQHHFIGYNKCNKQWQHERTVTESCTQQVCSLEDIECGAEWRERTSNYHHDFIIGIGQNRECEQSFMVMEAKVQALIM